MLPAWCGGWPCAPPPILPNQGEGTEKRCKGLPKLAQRLGEDPAL